ncbi:MAG TPA: DUF2255 family protein [Acidimicrobiales bacterium]|nr:DUF2255 family protein [Acidimicrobiales bacterium]
MTTSWSPDQLERISRSRELHIASRRIDGTLRPSVPLWVVCVDDGVYVRTWYRRATGWFGHVVDLTQAHIRVIGLETNVIVADVGGSDPGLRANVDAAYRTKYGPSGHQSMVTDDAVATTLRLDPQ